MIADLAVAVLLVAFAWVGVKVHDAIDQLAVLGRGVESAGVAVERGFDEAAGAVDGIPVVGDDLARSLEAAGEGTGGEAVDTGRASQERVHDAATVLGLAVFALPAVLLLVQFLPGRIREIRRLSGAARALAVADSGEERRLVAMRAAFSLPYEQILRFTGDPFGDLAAGRYDALVAAAFEDAGLRPD
jgi:hypothetical protein